MSYVRQELKPLLCEDQSQEVLRPVLLTLILLFKHAGEIFKRLTQFFEKLNTPLLKKSVFTLIIFQNFSVLINKKDKKTTYLFIFRNLSREEFFFTIKLGELLAF